MIYLGFIKILTKALKYQGGNQKSAYPTSIFNYSCVRFHFQHLTS